MTSEEAGQAVIGKRRSDGRDQEAGVAVPGGVPVFPSAAVVSMDGRNAGSRFPRRSLGAYGFSGALV